MNKASEVDILNISVWCTRNWPVGHWVTNSDMDIRRYLKDKRILSNAYNCR